MRFTVSPVLPIWLPMQKPELLRKIISHGSQWLPQTSGMFKQRF
jgi:hypothetical protein